MVICCLRGLRWRRNKAMKREEALRKLSEQSPFTDYNTIFERMWWICLSISIQECRSMSR